MFLIPPLGLAFAGFMSFFFSSKALGFVCGFFFGGSSVKAIMLLDGL